MSTFTNIAQAITRNIDDHNVVVGPMLSRLNHDASEQIPYFTVATSGCKQYCAIRIDIEHDNDRALLIAALQAMQQPQLILHIMDDKLKAAQRCEQLWPSERVTNVRRETERERRRE